MFKEARSWPDRGVLRVRRREWPDLADEADGPLSACPRSEIVQEGGVDLAYARFGGGAIPGVVDHVIRELRLLGNRHLALDLPLRLRGADAVARAEARRLGLL